MPLTFYATPGQVFMTDGGRPVTVTQDQADRYAAHYWEHGLEEQGEALRKAMQAAGFVPWADRRVAA